MVLTKDNPQVDIPHLSWRDNRYKRFYEVVDQLLSKGPVNGCHLHEQWLQGLWLVVRTKQLRH